MQRWLTLTSNHDTTLYRHSRHVGELTAVFAATSDIHPMTDVGSFKRRFFTTSVKPTSRFDF